MHHVLYVHGGRFENKLLFSFGLPYREKVGMIARMSVLMLIFSIMMLFFSFIFFFYLFIYLFIAHKNPLDLSS